MDSYRLYALALHNPDLLFCQLVKLVDQGVYLPGIPRPFGFGDWELNYPKDVFPRGPIISRTSRSLASRISVGWHYSLRESQQIRSKDMP